jgi:hypothetical protein
MTQYSPAYTPSATRSALGDGADSILPPPAIERPNDRAQSLSGSDDGGSGIHRSDIEVEGWLLAIYRPICHAHCFADQRMSP